SILYGFSPQRGRRYLPPVHGSRAGGSLVVSAGGARYTISRHTSPTAPSGLGRSPDRAQYTMDELRVLGPDGTLQPDYVLRGLLGEIDEPTFNHVFAVGLREVQELGTLSDSGAAEFLYHLSTGLNGVALADVLRDLAAARRQIVPEDHADGQLGELLTRRVKLAGEIDELRSQVHRQAAIGHELDELAGEVERCQTERAELERTERAVQAAVGVRDPWHRRAELVRELASLVPLPAVPVGAVERLDQWNESLESRRRRIAEIVRSRRSLRKEAAALDFNPRLARHAPRIEALAEQEAWLTTLEKQVEQQTTEIAALEEELSDHRREMGVEGNVGTPVTASDLAKRLRPAARALAGPQERLRAAQQEQTQATGQAEQLATQLTNALG
ncbi:MAG: hypothetical protein ACREHD_23940, partial [Pirellulales bacterium]